MVQLSIPRGYWRGFAELRELKEDQVQELVSVLEEEQATPGRTDLHARVASKVESIIGRSELNAIMDVLISLFGLRDNMRMDTPEFVGAISDAMDQSGVDDLAFPDEESRESFEARLARLLEIDSLEVAAKAIGLSYEQAHTIYGKPRVLTDAVGQLEMYVKSLAEVSAEKPGWQKLVEHANSFKESSTNNFHWVMLILCVFRSSIP